MDNVTRLPTKPRAVGNPLDDPQKIADALRERHKAVRVEIRIEHDNGVNMCCEAK